MKRIAIPVLVILAAAALLLAGCGGAGPRAVTADGLVEQSNDSAEARRRAEAVGLAQSAVPQEDQALAYVYQEPGVPLITESVSLDGGTAVPLRVNQYLVWQIDPGRHILEAWRGPRRLASRALDLAPGETAFFKFATKNNLGGLRYLAPAGPVEGRTFVRQANFGGQPATPGRP